MAEIIREITVDVAKANVFQAIVAKQFDSNSRFLKATITNNGEPLTIPSSASVTINALREDGNAKAFFGSVNDDGTITVPLSNWMLQLDGIVKCDISVITDSKLTTTMFSIAVEEAAYGGSDISDDPNYDLLIQLLEDCSAIKEDYANATSAAISSHNTDTTSHPDIRDEVDKLGNSIANSIYAHNVDETSHSDIRQSLISHNTDTTSHQDIRETINTLGSIHIPELIKSHNTDLEAHSDIRTEIETTRSQVIPAAINSHNTSTDAHTDIRQQRNADMDNLSANIIPGIVSAKVQAHNTDETAHSDIREKIAALESDSVPEYWQAELDNGVEAIRKAAETAGRNKSAFLWYTDAHWNNNSQMSPTLLKYLYEHTPINKVIFGGDIVNNEPTAETIDDRTIMAYLWEWRHAIRGLNHHSVIGNHDDGSTTNNIFPENYIYAYLLASEESNDIVYGDGFYYYIDDKCEKTRYLYLDTTYKGRGDKQLTFVKEALLTTPDDWHIVAIAHIWYQPDYEQYDVRPIPIKGLDDYSAKIIALLDSYNAREGDFATCGGKVEFCIGGHTHIDYDGRTPGGIPIILTETDSKHIRSTLTYTEGTITESSVNAVIPIYDDNKIYIIRIGRGESRVVVIQLEKEPTNEPTNVLLTAVSLDDMTSVLTGDDGSVGFLNNKRWSNSAASYIDLNGWDTSGAIPCKAGDVIRLKNITMYPYSDSSRYGDQGYINFYSSEGSYVNSVSLYNSDGVLPSDFAAEYDESGNIIQFTIPSWTSLINDMAYFSIACQDINENSVITINEELE